MPLVLIVDDEPSHRALLREALINGLALDFIVLDAGLPAIEVVQQHKPNLVVLDVNLPDMDGLQVCRRIKSDPALKTIPVIIVAADPYETEAREAGCDAYFLKPFTIADFTDTARRLIKQQLDS